MSYQTINKCCPQFSVTLQALWTTLTQRDCKPDGSSSSGILPNLWGKKSYPVIRDIILSVYFVWDIDFFWSFPEESPVSMSWWEGGSCRTWPSRGHNTQRGGTSCIFLFPLCFCFFFFLALMRLPCLQPASLQVLKGSEFNHIKEPVPLPMNNLCFLCYQ